MCQSMNMNGYVKWIILSSMSIIFIFVGSDRSKQ